MISISDQYAEEIKIVLGDLRRMAWDIPGNRASNMRRRAKIIIEYINNKQKKKYGSTSSKQLPRVG